MNITTETFFRPKEVAREQVNLPAPLFNRCLLLRNHSTTGNVFIPVRTMQYQAIIDADEPMAIGLWIVTGLISNDRMQKSIEEGFQKSTRGNTAPIREKIDALIDVYAEEIDAGDIFELVYLPGQGLNVYKNGVYTATIACGLSFKRALFGIWLSDRPVQTSLKRGMLGR